MLAYAFAVRGIQLLHLSDFKTGCIVLLGSYFCLNFLVLGNVVTITVTETFSAPITSILNDRPIFKYFLKIVFTQLFFLVIVPLHLFVNGLPANSFITLGLCDIVIPGVFLAFLFRFDESLKRGFHTYFMATFFSYILGLQITLLQMHTYRHAQPALPYLIPACLATPFILAIFRGDIIALLK